MASAFKMQCYCEINCKIAQVSLVSALVIFSSFNEL